MENMESNQSSLHEHSVDIDQYEFMRDFNMSLICTTCNKNIPFQYITVSENPKCGCKPV